MAQDGAGNNGTYWGKGKKAQRETELHYLKQGPVKKSRPLKQAPRDGTERQQPGQKRQPKQPPKSLPKRQMIRTSPYRTQLAGLQSWVQKNKKDA